MSTELLREAAALMRERSEAATGDRWGWRHFGDDPDNLCRVVYYPPRNTEADWQVIADEIWPAINAEHIASWHPAVALAVADWLDDHIDAFLHARPGSHLSTQRACAVARAYLGRDA